MQGLLPNLRVDQKLRINAYRHSYQESQPKVTHCVNTETILSRANTLHK